jgi:NitT/TauT family transport system permease protein
VLLAVYLAASHARLADNPNDKLLPSFASFGEAVQRMAVEPSQRSGEVLCGPTPAPA